MSSSPSSSKKLRPRHSWTLNLTSEHYQHGASAAEEMVFPDRVERSHAAQNARSHGGEQYSATYRPKRERRDSSSLLPFRSLLSHLPLGSNSPMKEFVVTRKDRTQSKANTECDEDKNLAPGSRMLTPESVESLQSSGRAQQVVPSPGIAILNPHVTVQEALAPPEDSFHIPSPTAASVGSNRSVSFASPVKTYSPRNVYPALVKREQPTMDPHVAVSKRSSVSTQHNLDSDFRLNTRRYSADHPVEKLKKRTSVLSMRLLPSLPASATSTTSDNDGLAILTPQRSASTSSSKSLSDHFAFLRFSSKSKQLSKTNALSPTTAAALADLSDLPADRVALEGRINYHISRLDRFKRRLADLNDAIQQESQEHDVSAANLRRQGMDTSADDLGRQLQWLRRCRDGLRLSVAFHRGELDRIGRKRVEMDVAEGYDAVLPAVYANLDGDAAWEQRFAI